MLCRIPYFCSCFHLTGVLRKNIPYILNKSKAHWIQPCSTSIYTPIMINSSLLQNLCFLSGVRLDVGPLGFLHKNGESDISWDISQRRERLEQGNYDSYSSFPKWGELLLSPHALPPTSHHTHSHTLGGSCYLLGNKSKSCLESYGTLWCWSTSVCVRMPRTANKVDIPSTSCTL